ncbi:MAG: hypothetical protein O3A21_09140 [Proteobacteria bacterium]|nr:hypothetical protein [Pseudomonadota bacterium]
MANKLADPKARAHQRGKVTLNTLVESVAANRIADHPWFSDRFLTGKASPAQLKRVIRQLVYYFDNVIELYGPMYLNSQDYKIRRLFTDKMLAPIKLPDGRVLRQGEGAHAELAAHLARALGAPVRSVHSVKPTSLMEQRMKRLIGTLERPAYWITLGASAAVESQMEDLHRQMARTLKQHYGVADKDLGVFKAPLLFDASDIRHTLRRCDDIFDRLKVAYYTERLRDEWFEVWDAAFTA